MMWAFPDIDPVAFSIGPFPIRWYALAYLAGFLLGWRYCMHLAGLDKDTRPKPEDIDDFLPWAIAGVILGGRLGYILFYNASFYAQYPLELIKLWHGGMSFHGGALGVILSMLIYSWRHKISRLRLADMVCATVPIGLFFGRLANFINGELFGRITESPWGMVFPRGGPLPRHPSQLYEAALEGFVLFIILFILIRIRAVRERPGIVSGAFLALYGGFRALIEFVREPDTQIGLIGNMISMGQILSLPMIAVGLGLIVYALSQKRNPLDQNAPQSS
ncbi:MAG: prolipoprotein diacylglyceryl transferase [Alphaproteobacteria bacterium]|nr:prolipoprotein diacylglyceryl transferase [Alphaproteobacteria bacterium]